MQDPLLRDAAGRRARCLPTRRKEQPQAVAPEADEVDCVVIGLGAGGAPLLARLAQAGLKVVALEAGPWHNPETDFATDEKAQDFLFWNDERLAAGDDPLAMGKNNSGTGVGGSTLHYTAYTPRPLPDDLHIRRDFGQGEDWPVSYEELEPYYNEVERFIGRFGPHALPLGARPQPGLPAGPAAAEQRRPADGARRREAGHPDLAGGQCGAFGAATTRRAWAGARPAPTGASARPAAPTGPSRAWT